MKFYYTYVLQSAVDDSRYIGVTENLKRRLVEHNSGGTSSLKAKLPVTLEYFEAYKSKRLARKRELQLKQSSWHKKQLFSRLNGE